MCSVHVPSLLRTAYKLFRTAARFFSSSFGYHFELSALWSKPLQSLSSYDSLQFRHQAFYIADRFVHLFPGLHNPFLHQIVRHKAVKEKVRKRKKCTDLYPQLHGYLHVSQFLLEPLQIPFCCLHAVYSIVHSRMLDHIRHKSASE